MTKQLIFSPTSQRDLNEILDYIAQDKPGAAIRFVETLRESCRRLSQHPHLGEDCSDLRAGMRRLAVRGYLIFYRLGEDKVEILRVLHGARDWPSLFP
jgi:toxin ParE1/3/4